MFFPPLKRSGRKMSLKRKTIKKPQPDKLKGRVGGGGGSCRVRHTNPYLKRRRLRAHNRANTVEMMDYVNKRKPKSYNMAHRREILFPQRFSGKQTLFKHAHSYRLQSQSQIHI